MQLTNSRSLINLCRTGSQAAESLVLSLRKCQPPPGGLNGQIGAGAGSFAPVPSSIQVVITRYAPSQACMYNLHQHDRKNNLLVRTWTACELLAA